jgi:signal peptidase II
LKILFISAVIIFTDQLSKLYIKGISLPLFGIRFDGLIPGHNYPALGDSLKLRLIENPGIGFGIYPGDEFKSLISVINLMLTGALLVYLISTRNDLFGKSIGAALLIGGAAGNLIDRMFYGVFLIMPL